MKSKQKTKEISVIKKLIDVTPKKEYWTSPLRSARYDDKRLLTNKKFWIENESTVNIFDWDCMKKGDLGLLAEKILKMLDKTNKENLNDIYDNIIIEISKIKNGDIECRGDYRIEYYLEAKAALILANRGFKIGSENGWDFCLKCKNKIEKRTIEKEMGKLLKTSKFSFFYYTYNL